VTCLHCGAPRPADHAWNGWGYEYKSATTVWGIPLVHVAFGRDKSGKFRTAKGIIAIGQFARGIITIAQFGFGVVFIGQFGVGLFVLAQFALGFMACGQFAVALYAVGQIPVALLWAKGQLPILLK